MCAIPGVLELPEALGLASEAPADSRSRHFQPDHLERHSSPRVEPCGLLVRSFENSAGSSLSVASRGRTASTTCRRLARGESLPLRLRGEIEQLVERRLDVTLHAVLSTEDPAEATTRRTASAKRGISRPA